MTHSWIFKQNVMEFLTDQNSKLRYTISKRRKPIKWEVETCCNVRLWLLLVQSYSRRGSNHLKFMTLCIIYIPWKTIQVSVWTDIVAWHKFTWKIKPWSDLIWPCACEAVIKTCTSLQFWVTTWNLWLKGSQPYPYTAGLVSIGHPSPLLASVSLPESEDFLFIIKNNLKTEFGPCQSKIFDSNLAYWRHLLNTVMLSVCLWHPPTLPR